VAPSAGRVHVIAPTLKQIALNTSPFVGIGDNTATTTWGIRNGNPFDVVNGTVPVTTESEFVLKLSWASTGTTLKVWRFDPETLTGAVTDEDDLTTLSTTTMNADTTTLFSFDRMGSRNGGGTRTTTLDFIRLGDTLEFVVPEPATGALALSAAASLLVRRRRQ
jgi:hypothetical protein